MRVGAWKARASRVWLRVCLRVCVRVCPAGWCGRQASLLGDPPKYRVVMQDIEFFQAAQAAALATSGSLPPQLAALLERMTPKVCAPRAQFLAGMGVPRASRATCG